MATQASQTTSPAPGTKLTDIDYELFGKEPYPTTPLDPTKMNESFGAPDFLLQDLAGQAENPSGRRPSLTGGLPPAGLPHGHPLLGGSFDIHQFDSPPGSRNTWTAARSPRPPEMGQRSRSNSLTGELEPLLEHLLPGGYANPGTPSAAGSAVKFEHQATTPYVPPGAELTSPPPVHAAPGQAQLVASPAVGSAHSAERDGTGRGLILPPQQGMPSNPPSASTAASSGSNKRDAKAAGARGGEGQSKRKQTVPAEEKAKIRAEQSRTSSRLYRLRKKEFQQHLEQHCDVLRQQQERTNKELAAAQELVSKLQEENAALRNLVQTLQATRR